MSGLWKLYQTKNTPYLDIKPSFSGRTVIVTGSNTGVGFEAAIKFVALDAKRVVLGVRSVAKGEDARSRIEERTGRQDVVEVWQLDMLDYDSIQAFARRADTQLESLDVAVLNAGVMFASAEQSAYGWEKTLQVNVISTALLGLLLLPKLKMSRMSGSARPVLELVGSNLHTRITGLDDPLDGRLLKHYSACFSRSQYSISKLFMEYINIGLADRAKSEVTGKPDVLVLSVSPGLCRSDLGRAYNTWYSWPAMWAFQTLFQRSAEEGARMYVSGTLVGVEGQGGFWHEGRLKEPAPLVAGEEGKVLQRRVWKEVMDALEGYVSGH